MHTAFLNVRTVPKFGWANFLQQLVRAGAKFASRARAFNCAIWAFAGGFCNHWLELIELNCANCKSG